MSVVVWQAQPNQTYQIIPVKKFFVSTGDFKLGTIVNVRTLGKVCTLDFTGTNPEANGKNMATVEFDANNKYSDPVYSSWDPKDNA